MELTSEATPTEVKKAYRRLAMKFHPDLNRNDPDCEERLKEINEAYQVLGDSEKRRHYDLVFQLNSIDPLAGDRQNVFEAFVSELWAVYGRSPGTLRRGGCKKRGFGLRGCAMRKWHAE